MDFMNRKLKSAACNLNEKYNRLDLAGGIYMWQKKKTKKLRAQINTKVPTYLYIFNKRVVTVKRTMVALLSLVLVAFSRANRCSSVTNYFTL